MNSAQRMKFRVKSSISVKKSWLNNNFSSSYSAKSCFQIQWALIRNLITWHQLSFLYCWYWILLIVGHPIVCSEPWFLMIILQLSSEFQVLIKFIIAYVRTKNHVIKFTMCRVRNKLSNFWKTILFFQCYISRSRHIKIL